MLLQHVFLRAFTTSFPWCIDVFLLQLPPTQHFLRLFPRGCPLFFLQRLDGPTLHLLSFVLSLFSSALPPHSDRSEALAIELLLSHFFWRQLYFLPCECPSSFFLTPHSYSPPHIFLLRLRTFLQMAGNPICVLFQFLEELLALRVHRTLGIVSFPQRRTVLCAASIRNAGVMTPCKKNPLNLYALLRKQGRLLGHCKRQCAESCAKKEPTCVFCDKFV